MYCFFLHSELLGVSWQAKWRAAEWSSEHSSGQYYFAQETTATFENSRKSCQNIGADLTSIHNQYEYKLVQQEMHTPSAFYFIGLSDAQVEGEWKWLDGSMYSFAPWLIGQPDGGIFQNCGVLITNGGGIVEWHDHVCSGLFKSICKTKGR